MVDRRSIAGAAWLALILVATASAQIEAGRTPADYLRFFELSLESPEIGSAQKFLVKAGSTKKGRTRFLTKGPEAYEKAKTAGNLLLQATIGPCLLAIGEQRYAGEMAGLLVAGDDLTRTRILTPLMLGPPSDVVFDAIPKALAKAGPEVRKLGTAVHADWAEKKRGSGVGTFLFLMALALFGGLGYVVSTIVGQVDIFKGKIIKWAETPGEHESMLKEFRASEEPVLPKLLSYLDKNLTTNELAALVDLLSHFQSPEVDQALKDHAHSDNKVIKQAAIGGMVNQPAVSWNAILVQLLDEGDAYQSPAAARSLAERKVVEEVPRIRKHWEEASGPLKEAYKDALERLAPKE